jgi:hypothetical protein
MAPIEFIKRPQIPSQKAQYERFDLDPNLYNHENNFKSSFIAVTLESDITVVPMQKLVSTTAIADPFSIDFACTAEATKCALAKQGFASAFARIADVLFINTQIRVSASFRSFCNGEIGCALENTVGRAAPSAFLFVRSLCNYIVSHNRLMIKVLIISIHSLS